LIKSELRTWDYVNLSVQPFIDICALALIIDALRRTKKAMDTFSGGSGVSAGIYAI
jgi:predicted SpoU family rRNA methylase